MKKLVTILFVLMVFVAGLFAEDEIPSNLKLKKQIAKFLDKKANNIVKRLLFGEYKNLRLKKLKNKKYKNYDIYQAKIRVGLNYYYRYSIVVKGDSLYLMPKDFNKLLVDSDNLATNRKKEKEIIRKFIELYLYNDVEIQKIERKKFKIKNDIFDYQVETWEKINGIKRVWGISFIDDQIYKRYVKILDVYSGDYIKDTSYDVPSKGASGSTTYNRYKVEKRKSNRNR